MAKFIANGSGCGNNYGNFSVLATVIAAVMTTAMTRVIAAAMTTAMTKVIAAVSVTFMMPVMATVIESVNLWQQLCKL